MLDSIARHRWLAAGATLTALGTFLALTALGVGRSTPHASRSQPVLTPLAIYSAHAPHVLSTLAVNSVQGAVRGAAQTPPPELLPLPASAFARPTARYRSYTIAQLGLLEGELASLQRTLAANDRVAAQDAWRTVYARYLRLGAVYLAGPVATLNREIDGTPGGLPGGTSNPAFVGLHRIEYGLWGTAAPRALLGVARGLATNVRELRRLLPHVSIAPLEYATRAHEILEDAARDLLSGADVPWSGEGVLATNAGLEATAEVIATLRPLLKGREDVLRAVESELALLRSTMATLATAHGGRLPTNEQLTQQQSERLSGTLGGTLEALAQVPGTLETEAPPQTPQIPRSGMRIDR